MFCSNCGKQLDENAKFCDGCGAQQGVGNDINSASNQQAPNPQQNVNANYQAAPAASNPKAKKAPKTKNIIITVAVALCAFIIGKFIIAPSMTSDSGYGSADGNSGSVVSNSGSTVSSTDNTVSSTSSQTQTDIGNNNSTYSSSTVTTGSTYDDILTNAYIVHFQPFFNMDCMSFVQKHDDGRIVCSDYGYEGDIVQQWVETSYVPVSNYDASQKATIESTIKGECAKFEALNCCTLKYQMGTNYFTVTITLSNVDKAENYSELYQAGILAIKDVISMSKTESNLIAQGAVKK